MKPGDPITVPLYGGRANAVVVEAGDVVVHYIQVGRNPLYKDATYHESDWCPIESAKPVKNPSRIKDPLVRKDIEKLMKRYATTE